MCVTELMCVKRMCVYRQGKRSVRVRVSVCVSGRLGFSLSTAQISCGAKLHLALSLSLSLSLYLYICFLSLSLSLSLSLPLSVTSQSHMTARNIPSFVGAKFQHPALATSVRKSTHMKTQDRTNTCVVANMHRHRQSDGCHGNSAAI